MSKIKEICLKDMNHFSLWADFLCRIEIGTGKKQTNKQTIIHSYLGLPLQLFSGSRVFLLHWEISQKENEEKHNEQTTTILLEKRKEGNNHRHIVYNNNWENETQQNKTKK